MVGNADPSAANLHRYARSKTQGRQGRRITVNKGRQVGLQKRCQALLCAWISIQNLYGNKRESRIQ